MNNQNLLSGEIRILAGLGSPTVNEDEVLDILLPKSTWTGQAGGMEDHRIPEK